MKGKITSWELVVVLSFALFVTMLFNMNFGCMSIQVTGQPQINTLTGQLNQCQGDLASAKEAKQAVCAPCTSDPGWWTLFYGILFGFAIGFVVAVYFMMVIMPQWKDRILKKHEKEVREKVGKELAENKKEAKK